MNVLEEKDLCAEMRDGTVLRANVYRPAGDGSFPVLLCRTPYDKENKRELAQKLAGRGYGVVIQDVRGRFASDGEFLPGLYSAEHNDSEDGYDTVEWAAALPWSTGKVGTFGCSYDAWTQWELAHTRPPHLVAMLASGIAANLLDRELSGVLRLGRVLDWTVNNLSVDTALRLGDLWKAKTNSEAGRLWVDRDRNKWLWFLPLMEIPDEVMPGMGRHWRRWLEDHATDHFKFLEKHKEVDVPVLNMTGWYDQQIGTIKQFTGMVENGRTERARENQYLVVGPWTHTLDNLSRTVGDLDFGPEAQWDFCELADAWFSHWVKDDLEKGPDWPSVRTFVMGANQWRGGA
ncbi:MAG: CocE/NonD family hydrolase, partial [bacterium]|nr:CocE/NonD family hydrolase [bacterium]